jgi:hypothetical protein
MLHQHVTLACYIGMSLFPCTWLPSLYVIIRSDAFMLASRFGSLADVLRGDLEDFSACPGLGPIKARRSELCNTQNNSLTCC